MVVVSVVENAVGLIFETGPGTGVNRLVYEAIDPFLMVVLVVGLTYDQRESYTSRFCNWAPVQKLGDISMSFYMIHMMVIDVIGYQLDPAKNGNDPRSEPWNTCSLESYIELIYYGGGPIPGLDQSQDCAAFVLVRPEVFESAEQCTQCWSAWTAYNAIERGYAVYYIPLLLAVSLLLGWVLYRVVELPAQAWIRSWKLSCDCCGLATLCMRRRYEPIPT